MVSMLATRFVTLVVAIVNRRLSYVLCRRRIFVACLSIPGQTIIESNLSTDLLSRKVN